MNLIQDFKANRKKYYIYAIAAACLIFILSLYFIESLLSLLLFSVFMLVSLLLRYDKLFAFIKAKPLRKLMGYTSITAFILLIASSLVMLMCAYGPYIDKNSAQAMVSNFEKEYLYQDYIKSGDYKKEKAELLSHPLVRKDAFSKFIDSVKSKATQGGDPFTYFNYDNIFDTAKKEKDAALMYTSLNKQKNVFANEVKENDYYVVWFSGFFEGLSSLFEKGITEHRSTGNLVIDLRNNHGGSEEEALKICDMLIPKANIYEKRSTGGYDKVTSDDKYYSFKKIFVLTNENTASAAEVLSLSLKENLRDKVELIGHGTYGKGVGQNESKGGLYFLYHISFMVVNFEWDVNGKTVKDLKSYLEKYMNTDFKGYEDYFKIIKSLS